MRCSHFESVLFPANLAINSNPILELKAKQEGRTQLFFVSEIKSKKSG
jgi:hypothetical protein